MRHMAERLAAVGILALSLVGTSVFAAELPEATSGQAEDVATLSETMPDGDDIAESAQEDEPEEAQAAQENAQEDEPQTQESSETAQTDVAEPEDYDDDGITVTAERVAEKTESGKSGKKKSGKDSGDGEEDAEDGEDDDEEKVEIIGFYVDPSKYPAADVNENTKLIYRFLTEELELNHAAACGVLANVQMESAFEPLALGDGGTSYGICQWHNERFNALISRCNSAGNDYNTLEGQLANMKSELEGAFYGVLCYMRSVPDTAQGAYDAGYYWCVHYESPSNAVQNGKLRGNLAMNEFYPKDLSMDEVPDIVDMAVSIRFMIDGDDADASAADDAVAEIMEARKEVIDGDGDDADAMLAEIEEIRESR